jgi:hypothetical protein
MRNLLVVLLFAVAAAGCNEYVNPWVDEYPGPEAVSTASVDGIRSRGVVPASRQRDSKPAVVSAQDGTVMHFPLWWEDSFEDKGSDDGQFAWTWEDYFAMPWSYGRMIVNTIGVPVSAVVQPPLPRMGSDGVLSRQALGYDHDAEWLGARGTVLPPDIVETGATTPASPNGNGAPTAHENPPPTATPVMTPVGGNSNRPA